MDLEGDCQQWWPFAVVGRFPKAAICVVVLAVGAIKASHYFFWLSSSLFHLCATAFVGDWQGPFLSELGGKNEANETSCSA
jgi:hypothetical protein